MFRFFVKERQGDSFILPKETLKHIKVARVEKEKFICIYEQVFYICELKNNVAYIIEKLNDNNEFDGDVIIGAAFIDTKRFEWLIQKATELGATKLVPIISSNISKKIPNNLEEKIKRWNLISLNAAEQSFRNKTMIIEKPKTFNEILKTKIKNKFIAHEKKSNEMAHISFPQDSLFLVGPEGGFTDEEVESAQKHNFEIISLGKRILRAETASIFILSRIN